MRPSRIVLTGDAGRNLLIMAIAVSAGALVSCGDDSTSSNVPERFTQVGNTWNYDVITRGLSPDEDTMQVSVRVVPADNRGPLPHPDAIWRISYGSEIDSNYVYVSDDTLKIMPKDFQGLWTTTEEYIFPMHVGKRWVLPLCCEDTTTVAAYDSIAVPAGTFKAYRVERNFYIPNDHQTSTTWIDPQIGIVRYYHSEQWTFTERTWNLLSYYSPLPPFRTLSVTEP